MKAQGGYFSCHKIFLKPYHYWRLLFYFLQFTFSCKEVQREQQEFPLLPRERVSVRYIASIVSSWVPWWEGDLAIHHRNDAGDL